MCKKPDDTIISTISSIEPDISFEDIQALLEKLPKPKLIVQAPITGELYEAPAEFFQPRKYVFAEPKE